jgi:hypothetical protein
MEDEVSNLSFNEVEVLSKQLSELVLEVEKESQKEKPVAICVRHCIDCSNTIYEFNISQKECDEHVVLNGLASHLYIKTLDPTIKRPAISLPSLTKVFTELRELGVKETDTFVEIMCGFGHTLASAARHLVPKGIVRGIDKDSKACLAFVIGVEKYGARIVKPKTHAPISYILNDPYNREFTSTVDNENTVTLFGFGLDISLIDLMLDELVGDNKIKFVVVESSLQISPLIMGRCIKHVATIEVRGKARKLFKLQVFEKKF